jgi:hypothetical protein
MIPDMRPDDLSQAIAIQFEDDYVDIVNVIGDG